MMDKEDKEKIEALMSALENMEGAKIPYSIAASMGYLYQNLKILLSIKEK